MREVKNITGLKLYARKSIIRVICFEEIFPSTIVECFSYLKDFLKQKYVQKFNYGIPLYGNNRRFVFI